MVITQIRDTLGWAIFHYLKGVISGFLDQQTPDVRELPFGVLMTCPNFYEVDCIFSPQKMIKRSQERLPSLWEIILLPFEENGHQLQQQQQKKQPSRQQEEPLRPSSNYASSSITTATTTSSTPSFGSTHRNARDTTIHDTFEETSTKANELKNMIEKGE